MRDVGIAEWKARRKTKSDLRGGFEFAFASEKH
jgi:hypothetical protein